jgi:hypothetical protein
MVAFRIKIGFVPGTHLLLAARAADGPDGTLRSSLQVASCSCSFWTESAFRGLRTGVLLTVM